MGYLKFDIASCKDCYSCLRNCPVKSIRFVDNKAEIIDEQCILCGHCVNVCPQNAKKVVSNIEEVEMLLRDYPGKVALTVAPSFISNFDVPNFQTFAAACHQLGFSVVEETSRGAYYVTKEYAKLLAEKKFPALISSACPSAVTYIRTMYPSALAYLAPVVSPMIAHARILKKEYGEDLRIVFVGPCIAKKKEAKESGELDCALTFEEMRDLFEKKGVSFEICEENECGYNPARYYPINRGIIKSFDNEMDASYDTISVDGLEEINDTLENISELDHIFIEMNMCKGGCINGPAKISPHAQMKDNSIVRKFVKQSRGKKPDALPDSVSLQTEYPPLKNHKKMPTETQIQEILHRIFKYRKEDEINCGACGYNTCREKAIAVFNGLADPEFCMPYLKNKAESISNEIITHTPNGIITVNKEGILVDANERSFEYLKIDKRAVGHFYQDYIDLPELMIALNEERNIPSVIVYNEKNRMYFDVSITVVRDHGLAFAIYKDVTQETMNDEKIRQLRNEMIEVTDRVINKQMAAVQEIASLLGESTAEAKIALINFKNSLKEEEK